MSALVYSYAYVLLVVAAGEVLRRTGRLTAGASRKLVHTGVGLWAWGTYVFFASPWWAAVPPASFVLVNFLTRRSKLLAYDEADADSWGTVLFPFAFALLLLISWREPRHYLLALTLLALADPVAALTGKRWGKAFYRTLGGGRKSLEGSFFLFLTALVASVGVQHLALNVPLVTAIGQGFFLAAVAALAEASGGRGLDNLLLPLAVAGADWLIVHYLAGPVFDLLGVAALYALAVAVIGYVRGALAPSGVLGAVLVGTPCLALGEAGVAVALVAFFVSSSWLSRAFAAHKQKLIGMYDKGHARDLSQALANGGAAAVLVISGWLARDHAMLGGAIGALAAANADTWATEVGGAFGGTMGGTVRLITTGRTVAAGTSGGVSAEGLVSAAAGALFIGGVAAGSIILLGTPADLTPSVGQWIMGVGAAGLVGSLVDSVLGATVQAVYFCPQCAAQTERQVHTCGTRTRLRRGVSWVTNDVVNVIAVCVGGLFGYMLIP